MSAARRLTPCASSPLLVLLVLLAACRPLYLPPIPEAPPFQPGPRVASGQVVLDDGRPYLRLVLADVSASGWLAVQWLGPSGKEVASESVWVQPGAAEAPAVTFRLPADVEAPGGEWRAVVSLAGSLLRQYSFVLD